MEELTFKEQAVWLPSVSPRDVARLPREADLFLQVSCQAHMQRSSLALIAIRPWSAEGHKPASLVFTSRISLINLKFLHLPVTSWDSD